MWRAHSRAADNRRAHSEGDQLKLQRRLLAACIVLAPVSITLYLVAWPGNLRDPIAASADAGSTGNVLHLIGAVAASFFLPLGYLGMSLSDRRGHPGRPGDAEGGRAPRSGTSGGLGSQCTRAHRGDRSREGL
ncbi:MAG: hypothetical protein E6H84_01995 [Chloroflexi bacterium]|nr:MAG: hypothetical protein E6H84_01995 [Chloroflexota bacterium]